MLKVNSAYMLTYIRKQSLESILSPVTEADVPQAVIEGFKEDERIRAEEEETRRKAARSTKIEVLFEKDVIAGPPNLPEIENSVVTKRVFSLEKTKTLNDLKELIESEVGIPKSRQAFFVFICLAFVSIC